MDGIGLGVAAASFWNWLECNRTELYRGMSIIFRLTFTFGAVMQISDAVDPE